MCSTVHEAFSGQTVKRNVKEDVVNSFLLQKELYKIRNDPTMRKPHSQKTFREQLAAEMLGFAEGSVPSTTTTTTHLHAYVLWGRWYTVKEVLQDVPGCWHPKGEDACVLQEVPGPFVLHFQKELLPAVA
ncbi:unnamed protein product [Boreogadus saida]